ncbi:hypothetical protein G9272_30425 [Streptomyces asoensis]|uniref:Uncharacterized protein n=1 Tax=Streptomyces asoensis TaxID=249586 RepID=A0A6M4WU71_9ACTN|nr:hypothetical protein [Streptomyces asoensis]QJT04067.1 hypothetical protein G9272_30425 [Streptomyces asoensis]
MAEIEEISMKKRIFVTCSFAILLAVSTTESGARPLGADHAESIVKVDPGLPKARQGDLKGISLVLLNVDRAKSRRGWDTLTVELGIRNNSDSAKGLAQMANLAGKVHVAEGSPTYDVRLSNAIFPKQTGIHDTLLPPGMAVCGLLNGSAEVVVPTAVGEVPATLHPTQLEFTDLPKVNLQSKPGQAHCAPALPSNTSAAPAAIELRRPDDSQAVKLSMAGFRPLPSDSITRLEGKIANSDRFGDLAVGPVDMWMIDRDGVARFSTPEEPYWDSAECNLGIENEQVIVPPALDSKVWACYPYRPPPDGHPAVAVIQYADNNNPSIMRLTDPL